MLRLRRQWERTIAGGVTQNSLIKTIFSCYKYQYLKIMIFNIFLSMMYMVSPLIIKPLVKFVEDGKNAWAPDVQFYDTSEIEWLKFLDQEKQYGLTLAMALVISQGVCFLGAEYASFIQDMFGAKQKEALVGLIYEKQFRISSATNKQFQ